MPNYLLYVLYSFGNRFGTKRLGFYGEVLTDSKLEPLGKAVDRAGFLSSARMCLLKATG